MATGGELVKDGGFKRSGTVAGFRGFQRQRLPGHSSRRRLQITLAFNTELGFSTAPVAPLFVWKNHRKLPPRKAQRILQKLRENVGLSAKATPHTLRHSFASELVRAGVTLPTVKSLLGHQWLSSTQIYTHTSNQERISAVALLAKTAQANP